MAMPTSRRRPGAALALVLLAVPAAGAGELAPGDYRSLVAAKAPALVTLRYVLKVEIGGMAGASMGGNQELESEITGIVIDPAGLVLCSNTQLHGLVPVMSRLFGGGMEVTATPTAIRVLADGEAEGLAATLVARDTDLDLAWVRLDAPPAAPLAHVDFAAGVELEVGQPFVVVRRMDRYFDRLASFTEGRVAAVASRPRRLYVPTGMPAASFGLPVFDLEGRVAGITVLQLPGEEGAAQPSPLTMMGMGARLQESAAGLILPAAEVARATATAREVAAEAEAAEPEPGAPEEAGPPAAEPEPAAPGAPEDEAALAADPPR